MRGDIPSYSPDSWAVSVIPKQLLVYLPDAVAPLPQGRGDGTRAYEQFFPKSVHVLAEHGGLSPVWADAKGADPSNAARSRSSRRLIALPGAAGDESIRPGGR